ncbi:unnamed protein product [Acanthoscelides obtectus]|uniref:Uncharacterized protein n=1 Tax=Acanthoscelides obtectus TaxID=200917 RepID=A0A9P0KHW9_ACAOB|nr:unnamed protein product [Acanthoscelides obtectus]CAK1656900.1 Protein prickle [Acanthoscelides obtectus]
MSNTAVKRENASSSANVLMCKQWWKVCWMYGDQEKYYRQLYGKRPTKVLEGTNNVLEGTKFNGEDQEGSKRLDWGHSFYENAARGQVDSGNSSFSLEEGRLPSPCVGGNQSPELQSLDCGKETDE